MIRIENLSKKYGRQDILKSFSQEFLPGQCVGLIGPNGSGKTTLIKSILGLVIPDHGKITVNGQPTSESSDYRHQIGYMPQITRFPDHMRVKHLFAMISQMRPDFDQDKLDEELYEAFEIEKMGPTALGVLSGGMRQKVSAALAFWFNPSILILDEPTAALDPVSNELLKQKINKCIKEGKLVLVTSHILNDLDQIVNHVLYLMDGEIIFSTAMKLLRQQSSETQLNKIIVEMIHKESAHVQG